MFGLIKSILLIKLLLLTVLIFHVNCEDLIVNTSHGQLQGRLFKSRAGRNVFAFSGIPFAKPPIGKLRFQDPERPEPWSGIRYAFNYGSVCVQIPIMSPGTANTTIGNEDCLYLSVYTPNLKPEKPLPVMVNFHGGGFFQGSGEVDRSPDFFMDHDVVMVLPNYRLGPLGFLTMEDDILQGNMGLKDQTMSLLWIRDNIANFGGDPNLVTIFGESAGGASVHYHMYSPMSKDLFHQAISQSGSVHAPWALALPGEAHSWATKMAEFFNCPTHNSQDVYECLIMVNSYDIIKVATKQLMVFNEDPKLIFRPIADIKSKTPFFPFEFPYKAEARPVPWMIGVASLEGILKTTSLVKNPQLLEELDTNFNEIAPMKLNYEETSKNPDEISTKLREFYFGDKSLTDSELFLNLTIMFGDDWFVWPMVSSLGKHQGPQYVYYLNYLGEFTFQEVFTGQKLLTGTTHWDDIFYLWKNNNPVEIKVPTSTEDINFSRFLVEIFVNFATYGNPTPAGSRFRWPKWDNDQRQYVSFEQDDVKIQDHFLQDRMQLWASLPLRDNLS